MGKQRISNMFTSSMFKKNMEDNKATSLSSDSIVDDVIAEFALDENERQRRRRGNLNNLRNFTLGNLNDALVKSEKPVIGVLILMLQMKIMISCGSSVNGESLRHLEQCESILGKEKVMPKVIPVSLLV
ncbi:DNA polymerase [Abeliophyllum distichum]|uniref:DNA polymerase n=1 Tax=Abeliophyllum distichum TaxID=126358 RepID=A0ABD1Q6B8_9LAMI